MSLCSAKHHVPSYTHWYSSFRTPIPGDGFRPGAGTRFRIHQRGSPLGLRPTWNSRVGGLRKGGPTGCRMLMKSSPVRLFLAPDRPETPQNSPDPVVDAAASERAALEVSAAPTD